MQQRRTQPGGWSWPRVALFLTALVALVMAVIVLGALIGVAVGVDMATATDHGLTSFLAENQTPSTTTPLQINTTGNWTVDDYYISLRARNYTRQSRTGYTTFQNDLHILTDRSLTDLYETCVHEKLHDLAPDAPHDWVYRQDESLTDATCLAFVYELGRSQ